MNKLDQRFFIESNPIAREGAIVQGDKYRFTVLTPCLIRLEYNKKNSFEDRATKTVLNRDFPIPNFRVIDNEDGLEIITDKVHLIYTKKEFHKNSLSIQLIGNFSAYRSVWYYGETGENLKGTARTLDEADGAIPLEDGLLSRNGFAIVDDSKSVLIEKDGWVSPRDGDGIDLYYFGYGRNYFECLKDFYQLSGKAPMLPRYSLGNWWSRFHRYSEHEYKNLFNHFEKEEIPFSVAVVDMDWHLTDQDINPRYGSGWTGYTWNRTLFPKPQEFMSWVHEKGLHITLNVHPADGVRAFEEMYEPMAKELGVDYEKEDKIQFDVSDPKFLLAYFKYLHHTNEDMGVDFWWVDWQQGGVSKIDGLDPLWMLNHYHYLDNKRINSYPLTFSRYAGIGSHRYPIGFSGDSFATWETLAFQPYFTATASNVGYSWWSHDIGGHMHGYKDDDMAARWLQFGVFSPIMRIHSSDNPFNEKEPWKYNETVEAVMKRFYRLRHQLVPYLYTMNYLLSMEGRPFLQPMYYQNPEVNEAYQVPNQYYFGDNIIVCPITSPTNRKTMLGKVAAWLPQGIYIDYFNGRIYKGNRRMDLFRNITTIPVLAKAGAILVQVSEGTITNAVKNPSDMEIKVFLGSNGSFTMYEDDNLEVQKGDIKSVFTSFEIMSGAANIFRILPYQGDIGVIPTERAYTISFMACNEPEDMQITVGGKPMEHTYTYDKQLHCLKVRVEAVSTEEELMVELSTVGGLPDNDIKPQIFDLLNCMQMEFDRKDAIYKVVVTQQDRLAMLSELQSMGLETDLMGALSEIITA